MFALKKIQDRVYLLTFDSGYDLAMHFLRYQEFYESPNEKFKNSKFTIASYMEWYSKNNEDKFTYPADWAGFNIPSRVFDKIFELGIEDENKYDIFMRYVYNLIRDKEDKDFYLMGAVEGDMLTIDHEMAHALWNLNPKYKSLMKENIKKLPKKALKVIRKNLKAAGYTKEVISDEIQAYLSTDLDYELIDELTESKINSDKIMKPFMRVLNKYIKST